ncbi:electron transfer flavoprotein subunit alpha/FixB family protein, partial [Burkholderia sp. Bp8998]
MTILVIAEHDGASAGGASTIKAATLNTVAAAAEVGK